MGFTFAVTEPQEGVGYFTIGGKIGASAVEEFGKSLMVEVEAGRFGEMILDCRGVEYISSAGWQVFMRAIQVRRRAGKGKMVCRVLSGSRFYEMLVSVGLAGYLLIRKS